MNANGQKFWMLADKSHWQFLSDDPTVEYDETHRSLRLANQRRKEVINVAIARNKFPGDSLVSKLLDKEVIKIFNPDRVSFINSIVDEGKLKERLEQLGNIDVGPVLAVWRQSLTDNKAIAETKLGLIPQTMDRHGNKAYWKDNTVIATGAMKGEVAIYKPSGQSAPTDMAMGYDSVLYLAIEGKIIMHDRRERWDDTVVSADGFTAWRIAADPDGGVWALDRNGRQLGRVLGQPFPRRPHSPYGSGVFRPCNENPNPPRLMVWDSVTWPADEDPVAIACSPYGKLACLSWANTNKTHIRCLDKGGLLTPPMELMGTRHPFSIGWVTEKRIAVLLAAESSEVQVYRVDTRQKSQWPMGDLYPLKKDYNGGPLVHGLDFSQHYPTSKGCHALHRLSFPFFSRHGEAVNDKQYAPLDSGNLQMVWHRLYLECTIPKGCGVKVWLRATNKEIAIDSDPWYEHRFGNMFKQCGRSDIPLGIWESFPSEVPHHPGLLPCKAKPGESGLFSVLIQRPGLRVRSLTGRLLHVRVELIGNGHSTPEIFALRAYGSRFSYVDEYLPHFYRETTFPPEANDGGGSTRPDFLERFIGNFEGVLTTLEDRIANSYLLTQPQTIPEESLEWLGSWIGFGFENAIPENRRREFLQATPDLYRWHGTLRGLKLALELATGGGITGGEIVVLEDFRLRRTFATILGADLDGVVARSRIQNKYLVLKLLNYKIIKKIDNDRICFVDSIKNETQLRKCFEQKEGIKIKQILAVGRRFLCDAFFAKSEFPDNDLISRLLEERIIKKIDSDPDRICFDGSINNETQLLERLNQKEGIETEQILTVWRRFLGDATIAKNEFVDNELISRLVKERIIKEVNPERICFDNSIKNVALLRKRLEQIIEIESVLAIWRHTLDDEYDPLTAAGAVSGNSYVGDTLFLGDENKKEFLALFADDLPADPAEKAAIDALFDGLAHRVTVLVHEEVEPQDLGLIRRIAEWEVPAHVKLRVLSTSHPFLVGMASLVGVDSYLAKRIPPKQARIGASHLGRRDFVQGPASLDPRLEGIGTGIPRSVEARPIAFAPDVEVGFGEDVELDASKSRAFGGREIIQYNWKFDE